MKLGVSYNVFDGEELLEGSIKQIRTEVDYVSVVYQTISNFGNPCNPTLISLLEKLKNEGLIDELYHYKPKTDKGGHYNEITKRNVGLSISQRAGCTHHMSMDSDEYYNTLEFNNIKKLIEYGDYDSSYCQMMTYYKDWEYVLDPPETYYVSLIFKLNTDSTYVFGANAPVLVDPTRKMSNCIKPLILERNKIQMHHGSYIRNDIKLKLVNSSASINFNKDIEKIVDYYNNWKYPNKALWGGLPSQFHTLKKIEKYF
jgi:hypothetical protein